jgi:uncharacterized damage-inducible protein DinB
MAGVSPVVAPLLYTLEQTREELEEHTAGLTAEQLWRRPYGLTAAGFHIRHMARSIDRLATYAAGRQLSEEQLAALGTEGEAGATREELLAEVVAAMRACEALVRGLDVSQLGEPRWVGRKRLPTTVQGLLVHIAEHTFRHLGQAITTIKLVRALEGETSG